MAIKGSIGRDQKVCNCFMPLLFGGALSWHNTSKERILSLGGGVVSAFSEYLNNCINKYLAGSELSKNDLISTCKVNRSTFFQCMRGMRVPTRNFFRHCWKYFSSLQGKRQNSGSFTTSLRLANRSTRAASGHESAWRLLPCCQQRKFRRFINLRLRLTSLRPERRSMEKIRFSRSFVSWRRRRYFWTIPRLISFCPGMTPRFLNT